METWAGEDVGWRGHVEQNKRTEVTTESEGGSQPGETAQEVPVGAWGAVCSDGKALEALGGPVSI